MPIETKQICKPYLILCEGKDAFLFLFRYLNSSALAQDNRFADEIQILDFGGNDNLSNFLMNLRNMDRFDRVTSLAVIRDAEKDYAKACQEVCNTLKKCGFASSAKSGTWVHDDKKIKIGFILFPLNSNAGTLEDLCLRILSDKNSDQILSLVDSFLATMETTFERVYRRKHKNKLHTYLSSSNEYVTMQIGTASQSGAFDWNSDELIPLRDFLADGF